MLENWLSPVPVADLVDGELEPSHFGANIRIFSEKLPRLKDIQIAVVGIGDEEANAVRKALYPMSFHFDGLKIADLGNIRKTEVSFVIPCLMELLDSRIFPLLIGADPLHILSQYKAFQSLQKLVSLLVVDDRIRLTAAKASDALTSYLDQILFSKNSNLFHLSLIGYQRHLTPPKAIQTFDRKNFDGIRLGTARADLYEMEPIVRDADLMSVHLAALKQIEAPGQLDVTSSGFFLEETCQISRYAGMSDKLKSFGVFGFRQGSDPAQQTAMAAAQILWYFIDGYFNRKNDFPASTDGLVEYIVDFKKLEYQITFWKSQKSGRWWMQIPVKSTKKNQRHRLVPCSYKDYKLACQEELPDRLLHALKRFS